MNDGNVEIPIKVVEGKKWLVLNCLGKSGIVRAAKIKRAKSPVPDWDGHHCDIASVEGSVRYHPKSWQVL